MADDDDTQTPGRLLHFPPSDEVRNRPPLLPDTSALFPEPETDDADGDSENTSGGIVLPDIPRPIDPTVILNSTGVNSSGNSDGVPETISDAADDGEFEDYAPPRSFADRLGDWIEFRIGRARDRHTVEQPAREAEIARKVELLKARTAHEAGVIQQNGKLQQAQLKARGDLASANGKSRGDSSKGAGGGKPGGGKPNSGSTNQSNGRPGSKTPDRRPNPGPGGAKPDQRRNKPPEKPPPGGGHNNKIPPKTPQGPGGAGGSGKDRPKGPDGGGKKNGPGTGTGGGKGPAGKDLKKQEPSNGGGAKKPGSGNGTGGGAKKVDLKKSGGDKPAKDGRDTKPQNVGKALDKTSNGKGDSNRQGPRKINLTKDKKTSPKAPRPDGKNTGGKGPGAASDGSSKASGTPGPGGSPKGSSGPSGSSTTSDRKGPSASSRQDHTRTGPQTPRRPWESRQKPPKQPHGDTRDSAGQRSDSSWWRRTTTSQDQAEQTAGPVTAESAGITVERSDTPPGPRRNHAQHPSPAGLATSPLGLPAAPEPHTQRPGTSRPSTEQHQPTGETVSSNRSQAGEINLDEFLTSMANIAVETQQDTDGLVGLLDYLAKAVDEFRTMADVLTDEHNIDRKLTLRIDDLADLSDEARRRFGPDAQSCHDARESVLTAAKAVALAYRPDMDAMEEAGLAEASTGAHHD